MSSFINLFASKAPNIPAVMNPVVLFIGAQLFNLGIDGKALCQSLLHLAYRSRMQKGSICFEIVPSPPLNYAVGWND
jgi:hypothetical protein